MGAIRRDRYARQVASTSRHLQLLAIHLLLQFLLLINKELHHLHLVLVQELIHLLLVKQRRYLLAVPIIYGAECFWVLRVVLRVGRNPNLIHHYFALRLLLLRYVVEACGRLLVYAWIAQGAAGSLVDFLCLKLNVQQVLVLRILVHSKRAEVPLRSIWSLDFLCGSVGTQGARLALVLLLNAFDAVKLVQVILLRVDRFSDASLAVDLAVRGLRVRILEWAIIPNLLIHRFILEAQQRICIASYLDLWQQLLTRDPRLVIK